ncbi:MAG TPA: serine protease, partial [Burkholderiales bacterium]|nr:serine protease [Burkholderiales bacterium]
MRAGTDRFKASLARAKAAHLDTLLKDVSVDEEREATARQIEARRLAIQRDVADPLAARVRLERILKGNDLSDISYLEQGLVAARPVCRIVLRRNGSLVGYGTGFLIAPGVLMTNQHVFEDASSIQESIAQFRYERDVRGLDVASVDFGFRLASAPIISKELDFAIVQVEPRSAGGAALEQFGWLRLDPTPGKAFVGEYLTIIQHPKGERKQICVRENKLLKYAEKDPYVWYQTDTVSGSSGSPVFNNSWEVVALHHSSVPQTRRVKGKDVWLTRDGKLWSADMGEDEIAWKANEGIRVSRIVEHLSAKHATHPLAKSVLTARDARAIWVDSGVDSGVDGDAGSSIDAGEIQVRSDGAGNMRILIPVDIKVGAYGLPVAAPAIAATVLSTVAAPVQVVDPQIPLLVEKVLINQSNYARRNGYDPKFLGAAKVPLPKVASEKLGKLFRLSGKKAELKYW